MSYDQITKDLCKKVTHDTKAVVDRTASLLDSPAERMMVAISAAAGPMGSAMGFAMALAPGSTPDDAADALWEIIRPLIVKTGGGDEAPYRAMLAKCRP